MTVMESQSKEMVMKSLLNLGILLFQKEFEETWPEQSKSDGDLEQFAGL